MNDKQNAKQNMHQAVLHILRENQQIYSGVPAFVRAVEELELLVKEIDKSARLQSSTVVKGATNEKRDAETVLVSQCIKIANAIYVLAIDENNLGLLPKATINKSMLYNAQNNETLGIAVRICNEAEELIEKLAQYGINQAEVDVLKNAIENYERLIAKPRAAISEKKQTTANLVYLFARTDTILNDRLDKLMSLFKIQEPDFYAVYFNARNIMNTAARKRKSVDVENLEEKN